MIELLLAEREAAGAVGHHPLTLGRADRHAEIGLARQAVLALAAFGGVERDHMIAFGEAGHPAPDIDDDAGPFVAEDRRKQPLGVGSRQSELVGMADAGCHDLDQHLPVLWAVEPDRLDRQLLSSLVSNSSASLHERLPQFTRSTTSGRETVSCFRNY